MNRLLSALSLVVVSHLCGATLDVASAADAPASDKQFLIVRQEADPRLREHLGVFSCALSYLDKIHSLAAEHCALKVWGARHS